ncbi:Sjogrens syndrome scleroderma autoantigen 1 family protein [Mycena kentingensis (nom. inval.)]|nr:Sjogrens syndrome scleroderma autoantigen 1 family protein [Mycena kentingensis (nom. inval.)]
MASDVSALLGDYMLRGWILTDRTCPAPHCSVPLMRSPSARTPVLHFCASCDGPPDAPRSRTVQTPALRQPQSSAASTSSSSHLSRSSTPPTEVTEGSASEFALPPESAESRQRREQSDMASTEIGKRLLKGWAMLADECPNCFGIPLVRPPNAGGERDPRKECVLCGRVYVTEVDWAGREALVLEKPAEVTPAIPVIIPEAQAVPTPPNVPVAVPVVASSPSSLAATLEQSIHGLEDALRSLTGRLTSLTAGQADSSSITNVADAISAVVKAIAQAKQLQRNEAQTGAAI